MGLVVKRFDVFLINLDPTTGAEIQKTRPCLIISPDEMNRYASTTIVAPMTTGKRSYVTRIACQFQGTQGHIVLDQIRTVDKSRLIKKLGKLDRFTQQNVLKALSDMFAE